MEGAANGLAAVATDRLPLFAIHREEIPGKSANAGGELQSIGLGMSSVLEDRVFYLGGLSMNRSPVPW